MSVTPTQFKIALAALAVFGAAAGGGAAWLATRPAHGGLPAAEGQSGLRATVPHWNARVTSIAGDGLPGVANGGGRRTRFADPYGVAVAPDGTIFVADGGDGNSIRRIAPDGATSVLAGAIEGYAEGQGKAAAFHTPSGLALDAQGNLYVADTGNHAIRKITPDGMVSTLAGDGLPGYRDGKGAAARFDGPLGVAVDAAGVVYVADSYNDRIRRIAPDGTVTTVAGDGRAGLADGPAAQARFNTPAALVAAPGGVLFIADAGNNAIRKLGQDGAVTTVASAPEDDRDALLLRPVALALSADGYLYAASNRHGRVVQVTPKGEAVTLVDVDHMAQPGYGPDGSVRLYQPRGLALAPDGALLATDAATFRLLRIAPPAPGDSAPPEQGPAPLPSHPATMLWPVKPQDQAHEVVGVMGEVRGKTGGDSRDHFHAGLDVQAATGTPVLAVTPAKVADPLAAWGFGELSEGMALDSLRYVHMTVGRGPGGRPLDPRFQLLADGKGKPAQVRVRRGARFAAGDTLGLVNAMAHVHLDYLPNGGPVNPLVLPFIGLEDSIAPEIERIALLDGQGKPLADMRDGRLLVPRSLGELQITVEAWDQVSGNQARRRLGLYRLGYQLLNADGDTIPGMEQPVITQQYDRLPRNREAVKTAYAGASGITVHGAAATRFVYAINNRILKGQAEPGAWQVARLGPGNYILRIIAADYAGNIATRQRDLAITVD
ncbi:gluconolaconase [Oxalobacteraceae bacterium A2-2]